MTFAVINFSLLIHMLQLCVMFNENYSFFNVGVYGFVLLFNIIVIINNYYESHNVNLCLCLASFCPRYLSGKVELLKDEQRLVMIIHLLRGEACIAFSFLSCLLTVSVF